MVINPTLPDVIRLDLAARTGIEAVKELQAALAGCPAVTDAAEFLRALAQRQSLGAVCLDAEVALPHARTSAVDRIVIAVGRSKHGIWFDADHPSIRLVVLMGAPPDAVGAYLQCTAQIARLLRDATSRQGLLGAGDEAMFRERWARSG